MASVKVAVVNDMPVKCSLTHLMPALQAPSRLGAGAVEREDAVFGLAVHGHDVAPHDRAEAVPGADGQEHLRVALEVHLAFAMTAELVASLRPVLGNHQRRGALEVFEVLGMTPDYSRSDERTGEPLRPLLPGPAMARVAPNTEALVIIGGHEQQAEIARADGARAGVQLLGEVGARFIGSGADFRGGGSEPLEPRRHHGFPAEEPRDSRCAARDCPTGPRTSRKCECRRPCRFPAGR